MSAKAMDWTSSDDLVKILGPMVKQTWGEDQAITRVHCNPISGRKRPGTYKLHLRLQDGRDETFFLKDMSWESTALRKHRVVRRRELCVYRDLLARLELDLPRYRWAEWEESHDRMWMLLDWVDGTPLTQTPWEQWLEAARWLARFQCALTRHPELLVGADYLESYNADFFRQRAGRALPGIRNISHVLADRLEKDLPHIDSQAEVGKGCHPNLVHGEFEPVHVLLATGSTRPRLVVVDWEKAGIGSGLYDLAMLGLGLEEEKQVRLLEAYRHEADAGGLPLDDSAQAARLLQYFQLNLTIARLGKARDRGYPAAEIEGLINRIQGLTARFPEPGSV